MSEVLAGTGREAGPTRVAYLYFETARHLRARQVWGWAAERVPVRPLGWGLGWRPEWLGVRPRVGEWVEGYLRPASMLPEGRVWLLNQGAVIGDWNAAARPRLWNYHLHYFEDPRVSAEWVERWIRENPVGEGAGWEPYPLSRRMVNWIRWALRETRAGGPRHCGNPSYGGKPRDGGKSSYGGKLGDGGKPGGWGASRECEGARAESLAAQARALFGKIEYRLLANHLFVNAKALVYAGTYFRGPEAERWLAMGLEILDGEVREQILADGGHYERSPMYHALILEDLLDLESLRLAYPGVWAERPEWRAAAERMRGWLGAMTHPDGEIAFFQDACLGVAPGYAALSEYAERLGYGERKPALAQSGYRRLERGELVALFDCGAPGPEYQPGHAHAGTLSVEASWRGGRVLVNSGTSTYEAGDVRAFERSTAAHATVRVDGRDSSEMWGAFRVARRARVVEAAEGVTREGVWARAAHTGYRPVRHERQVTVTGSELIVRDVVSGGELLEWFFPLHPSIEFRGLELWREGERIGRVVPPEGVRVWAEGAEWRPEFYRRVPAVRLRMEARPGPGGGTYETRFCFEEAQ